MHLRHPITKFTKHALRDSDDWPAGLSLYYFGVMPKLDNLTSILVEGLACNIRPPHWSYLGYGTPTVAKDVIA
ncbi:hypothetical protein H0H92_009555 [Tricholoma furcatifolium]|nr:hypothetical protein H0H92_009555 [Tricholoma furcatifolium]